MRLFRTLLVVLLALVLGAGTGSAAAAGWSVTPGGPFTGVGGPLDPPLTCAGSQIAGRFTPGDDVLGVIDEVDYQDCVVGGLMTFEMVPIVPWTLHGVSHSAGVTALTIENVAAHAAGPGCAVTVEGSVTASFDNATSVLTVHGHHTTVTAVDPVDDCLGLIHTGEPAALLSNSYLISPAQEIVPVR
jgi:hypothetical protein